MNDEPKRSISGVFVAAMDGLEKGRMTLAEFNQLVDLVAKAAPGDQRQKQFYKAIKALAKKVAKVTKK